MLLSPNHSHLTEGVTDHVGEEAYFVHWPITWMQSMGVEGFPWLSNVGEGRLQGSNWSAPWQDKSPRPNRASWTQRGQRGSGRRVLPGCWCDWRRGGSRRVECTWWRQSPKHQPETEIPQKPHLKKHIPQYKEFIVNLKIRTFSHQVVSNGVPLGQLDHFEFNSPYHSRTFQTISINLIFYLHLLDYDLK